MTVSAGAAKELRISWELTRRSWPPGSLLARSGEMLTFDAYKLIDQIVQIRPESFTFTGEFLLQRPDFFELLHYAGRRGLQPGVEMSAPSDDEIHRLRAAGTSLLILPLDAASAEIHEVSRQTIGSFARSIAAIKHAREQGMPVQVNTVVTVLNHLQLESLHAALTGLGVARWNLTLPVPRSQDEIDLMPSPKEAEAVFRWLERLDGSTPMKIMMSEAVHLRRLLVEEPELRLNAPRLLDPHKALFINHLGEVCPSEFLPISIGNVRFRPLRAILDQSRFYQSLRDPLRLEGKCSVCNYVNVCGGSRARAYAMTGDPFSPDPLCQYEPAVLPLSEPIEVEL